MHLSSSLVDTAKEKGAGTIYPPFSPLSLRCPSPEGGKEKEKGLKSKQEKGAEYAVPANAMANSAYKRSMSTMEEESFDGRFGVERIAIFRTLAHLSSQRERRGKKKKERICPQRSLCPYALCVHRFPLPAA